MPPSSEETLFAIALTKPAAERAAWLDRECGEDKTLRARLESLLAATISPTRCAPRRLNPRVRPSSSISPMRPTKPWA